MRVLVVDDEAGKRASVVAFLRTLEITTAVNEARSYQSALQSLRDAEFDWIVLDMRLTSYDVNSSDDGGRPRNFGGEEILRKLKRRKVRSRVVVLTQYTIFRDKSGVMTLDQLAHRLIAINPNVVGVVQFQQSSFAWQDGLSSHIQPGPTP